MATEVLNSGHGRPRKTRRAKSKNRGFEDEEETLSPRDEMKEQTKAAFDEYLKDALTKSQDIDGKSKKKKKRVDEQVLESLRKGDGLRKDKDNLLDANTFDPEDTKTGKSNKKRQKERDKKGSDNPAFDKDEIISTKKGKKKSQKDVISDETIIDKGEMTISELATSPPKDGKKKKKKKTEEVIEEAEPKNDLENELSPPPTERKKKKKKKNIESDLEEYQQHLKQQDESQSDANTTLVMEEREKLLSDEENSARKKKKKKKTKEPAETEIEAEAADNVEAEQPPMSPRSIPDEGRVLGITVHRTDKLKTDFWMAHPLVRITLVDLDTGHYLKKQHKERAVASFFENENEKVDFVLPIMTQPFDFKQNKSTLPLWEEMIVLNENYNYFIKSKPNVMAFFELLDFVTMNAASQKYAVLQSEGGWHRIAWAFLKLVGANGKPNTDKKVRLQLYQPPTRFRAKKGSIEVYQWWKSNLRAPYPSTLYLTMKGIVPPDQVEPSARSMFATQREKGKTTYDDLQKSLDRSGPFSARGNESARVKGPSQWNRLMGQACKIPNYLYMNLPGGRNGCFVVKFSHDGKCLACACHDKDGYVIYLYEIPDGKLRGQIEAHFSLIYDLSWCRGDTHLVSASADGTARVWNTSKISNSPVKTLPHPSFVYTAKFHPRVSKVIATGGYDSIIRVWSIDGDDLHGQLVLELDGHMSFVNTVCFDNEGNRMFSGDRLGTIIIWNVFVTDKPSSNGLLEEWTENKKIQDEELKGVCISNLKIHPNGRRLLVHCRDNNIRMVDLRVGAIMQRYIGALNFREHIRSTLSPCGTFVAAGSEDCCAYIWNTETGDQVAMYSDLGYKSPVCDVDFHTQDHMIAFCSFSDNSPIMIYKYDHRVAQHDVGIDIDDDLRKRARSPDLRPGYDIRSEDEGLEESQVQVLKVHDDLRVHDIGRLDRVNRKLQSLNAFSSFRPVSPDHSRVMSPTMGASYLGSTYNTTGMYTQDSRPRAFLHVNRPMQSPEPGMFSPHASRPSTAALEHQQQFASQSQYMRQSQSGWRPSFSEISRSGRVSGPVHIGRPPQLSLTATQLGKPQFSFQGKSKKSEVVVALYDYQAQRSDELSFVRGDEITVLYKDNDSWWMGELQDGQQGFFPANYIAGYDSQTEVPDILPEYVPQSKVKDEQDVKPVVSAVKMKSGELKFISGAEESDLEAPTRSKKKTTRKSRDSLNFENEEIPMTGSRRKHRKSRIEESTA